MFTGAIARRPGPDCAGGITGAGLGPPDYDLLLEQHDAYVGALRALGLDVVVLDPLPGYPDAYFVEDTAVVTPEVAVITNPGADARKGEIEAMEPVLARVRETVRIREPGTSDGGDVLQVGRHFFIGISGRTNEAGAAELGGILAGWGYTWEAVPVGEGLHLKAFVNHAGGDALIMTGEFSGRGVFEKYDRIVVPSGEEYAANTLYVNNVLIVPAGCPGTKAALGPLGREIVELDMSEARRMDGGLTCMSLRL